MFMFVYDGDHTGATFGKTKLEALDVWLCEMGEKIEDIEPDACEFWVPVPSKITQTVKQMVTYDVE